MPTNPAGMAERAPGPSKGWEPSHARSPDAFLDHGEKPGAATHGTRRGAPAGEHRHETMGRTTDTPPTGRGGGSRETGATTHSMGAGGQGTAREAVDPDVPDTGEGAERERARAARASPSARGTCDIQRVTQPLPPVACSLGGPGLAPGHRGSNQPTNQPTPPPHPPPSKPEKSGFQVGGGSGGVRTKNSLGDAFIGQNNDFTRD